MEDKEYTPILGPQNKEQGPWDEYVGHYIKIRNSGNTPDCMGKLVKIIDGHIAKLLPFVTSKPLKQGGSQLFFIEEGVSYTIPLAGDRAIEPTSRDRIDEEIEIINGRLQEKSESNNAKGEIVIAR